MFQISWGKRQTQRRKNHWKTLSNCCLKISFLYHFCFVILLQQQQDFFGVSGFLFIWVLRTEKKKYLKYFSFSFKIKNKRRERALKKRRLPRSKFANKLKMMPSCFWTEIKFSQKKIFAHFLFYLHTEQIDTYDHIHQHTTLTHIHSWTENNTSTRYFSSVRFNSIQMQLHNHLKGIKL